MKGKQNKRSREGSYAWKNGNLYARLQYTDETGKLKEKTRRVESNKVSDVWAIIRELKDTFKNQGVDALKTDKMTFEQLAERYRQAKVFPAKIKDGKKIAGLKSYKSEEGNLRTLIEHFKKKPIRNIRPHDIEKFKQERLSKETRLGKERKIASVNRELSTLRAMLNFALRNDWIIQNPCLKVEKLVSVSLEVERDRILSFEEESRLFSVLTTEREHLKPIFICALDTAMRPEEIFKLIWRDIDFHTKTITVIAQNSKTEKERIIGMTDRLFDELHQLWEVSPKRLDFSVFGTKSIKTAFHTACRLADLKDLRFRDFRHTATTRMVESKTMEQAEIMKITGHTQLKTFLRYVNLTKESASESATKFSNYLDNKFSERNFQSEAVN
jgi:integrase